MKLLRIIFTLFALLLIYDSVSAQGQLYLSEHEPDWFTPGEYFGIVHSNDTLRFRDVIDIPYGLLSTSQDRFIFADGMGLDDLNLNQDPVFNEAPIQIPQDASSIRNNANPFISDMEGRLMTRIKFSVGSIEFWQRPLGGIGEGDEELVLSIASPAWGCVYIDGQCEIEGVVTGKLTIGSSGDMWLIDDIRYEGARADNGRFSDMPTPENVDQVIEQMMNFPHMLGLVSEGNIIIRDNPNNGKENGFANDGNQGVGRHSIIINAALLALGGSLKFEHTNADWERYQGPEPDERGIVHLTGAVIQHEGFPLHNENHEGTGYIADYLYDFRFSVRPPPLFPYDFYGEISPIAAFLEYGRQLEEGRIAIVSENSVGRRLRGSGGEIRFAGPYTLRINQYLGLEASPEDSIQITFSEYGHQLADIHMHNSGGGIVKLKHVNVAEGVELYFECDSIQIDSCSFAGPVFFRGDYVKIENSHFTNDVELGGWSFNIFEHNVVEGTVTVSGNPRFLEMTNNTIINPDGNGIFLDTYRNAYIRNNIITNCERGIVNDHWQNLTLEYNDVFCDEDYVDCEPGIGSISAPPRFVDADSSDYQLQWNSPCIDAGDPDSPQDPDGTRADMGAFYRDRGLSASDEPIVPDLFTVTASPNPFNSMVTLRFSVSHAESVQLSLYDLSGREVLSQTDQVSAGVGKISVSGEQLGSAGVYFARIQTDTDVKTVKLIYMP